MNVVFQFLNDMHYNINNPGDRRSDRYKVIKGFLQPQIGSGLKFTPSPSKCLICICLPSDPDELVDQLQLFYQATVGENDSPQLNELLIASADKLLQYQCITPSQH